MTNRDILRTAVLQSSIDLGCNPEDFFGSENKVVISGKNPGARKYLELPFECNLVSYGNCIVASSREDISDIVRRYIEKYHTYQCFEPPSMNVLSEELNPYRLKPCFMAEYFLPDMENLRRLSCNFPTRVMCHDDFSELYTPQWSNALCEDRRDLDVLGVGAYDGGKLIGLAACSADCDSMWQIGVDVLPEYRRCGIASAVTSALTLEIISRGKVPFYCAAWSNIGSVRNAVKSGFRPAWVELTVKKSSFVDDINR